MQICVNGEEVNIDDPAVVEADEINMRDLVDCLEKEFTGSTVVAIEIDEKEYIPGEVADKNIDTGEVERLNFVTAGYDDINKDLTEEIKKST